MVAKIKSWEAVLLWALPLGVLLGLSSPAEAQLFPQRDQHALFILRALPVQPVEAIQGFNSIPPRQSMGNGFPESKAYPVQLREPTNPDRRRRDSSLPDIHEDFQESACAQKVRKIFPVVELSSSALALEQARVDHKEHTVVIPLKEPHEEIRAIRFDTQNISEALDLIRLLQAGKIGAVGVSPLARRPSTFYMFRGVTKEDREICKPERILELLGKCSECEVLEWLALKP